MFEFMQMQRVMASDPDSAAFVKARKAAAGAKSKAR